jgi:hypothetical protein
MFIKGIYVGLPVSELERIRTQLFEALNSAREGSRFSEVDMGGKMGKKALLSYNEIVHELQEVLLALKKAQPDIYGKPIKRLVPNFNKHIGTRVLEPFVCVYGIDKHTGGLIKDGAFTYKAGRSLLTFEHGYYEHFEQSAQLAKNGNGLWGLYGIAGYRYDYQRDFSGSPLTTSGNWDVVQITL